jgi:hypothetical protein
MMKCHWICRTMYHARTMHHVACSMYHVPCSMKQVACTMCTMNMCMPVHLAVLSCAWNDCHGDMSNASDRKYETSGSSVLSVRLQVAIAFLTRCAGNHDTAVLSHRPCLLHRRMDASPTGKPANTNSRTVTDTIVGGYEREQHAQPKVCRGFCPFAHMTGLSRRRTHTHYCRLLLN